MCTWVSTYNHGWPQEKQIISSPRALGHLRTAGCCTFSHSKFLPLLLLQIPSKFIHVKKGPDQMPLWRRQGWSVVFSNEILTFKSEMHAYCAAMFTVLLLSLSLFFLWPQRLCFHWNSLKRCQQPDSDLIESVSATHPRTAQLLYANALLKTTHYHFKKCCVFVCVCECVCLCVLV